MKPRGGGILGALDSLSSSCRSRLQERKGGVREGENGGVAGKRIRRTVSKDARRSVCVQFVRYCENWGRESVTEGRTEGRKQQDGRKEKKMRRKRDENGEEYGETKREILGGKRARGRSCNWRKMEGEKRRGGRQREREEAGRGKVRNREGEREKELDKRDVRKERKFLPGNDTLDERTAPALNRK